jgi:hypothetical protein
MGFPRDDLVQKAAVVAGDATKVLGGDFCDAAEMLANNSHLLDEDLFSAAKLFSLAIEQRQCRRIETLLRTHFDRFCVECEDPAKAQEIAVRLSRTHYAVLARAVLDYGWSNEDQSFADQLEHIRQSLQRWSHSDEPYGDDGVTSAIIIAVDVIFRNIPEYPQIDS